MSLTKSVDRFVCIFADTDEARRHHFQLRFRIFCEETGFENPQAFPGKLEYDRHDGHALHFIVWDRFEQQWAGAMRLVRAASRRLPSEEIVGAPLHGLESCRSHAVEFSRLCILNEYRRTTKSATLGHYQPEGQPGNRGYPALFTQEDNDVLVRLLRASFGWQPRIQFCYFIVTAALSRVLSRFGIPLTRVGTAVEHRGTRIPFRYDVEEARAGMLQILPSFAAMEEESPPYIRYSDFMSGQIHDNALIPQLVNPSYADGPQVMRA